MRREVYTRPAKLSPGPLALSLTTELRVRAPTSCLDEHPSVWPLAVLFFLVIMFSSCYLVSPWQCGSEEPFERELESFQRRAGGRAGAARGPDGLGVRALLRQGQSVITRF